MKIAGLFLVVALSCYFETPNALLPLGKTGKGGPHKHGKNIIPVDCIKNLLTRDLPNTLISLQQLLCTFAEGQQENNIRLYKKFLDDLHELLKTSGCAADQIAGLKTPTVEQLTDKVGELAENVALELLKALEQTKLLQPVLDLACNLAGDIILKLGDALAGLNVGSLGETLGLGPLLG